MLRQMGPIALFDKSFLQSLSIDESVWFDHFFYPTICPLFYVETLADLTKSVGSSGRTAEDAVRIIADKTPVLSGGPCMHHRELCIANLMGHPVPMSGQVPRAGGRRVKAADGKRGVVFDESPEAQAFSRWQHGEFHEVERRFAAGWRRMLTTLDLPAIAERIRTLGISPKECKTVEIAMSSPARRSIKSRSPSIKWHSCSLSWTSPRICSEQFFSVGRSISFALSPSTHRTRRTFWLSNCSSRSRLRRISSRQSVHPIELTLPICATCRSRRYSSPATRFIGNVRLCSYATTKNSFRVRTSRGILAA